MTYGPHDALVDVVTDLRARDSLVQLLDGDAADVIDEGWPADPQTEDVVVRVQPVTESSAHRGTAVERTFRLQFAVIATQSWREQTSTPTHDMAEIMHEIGLQMESDIAIDELLPGETASSSWESVEGSRLALIQDIRTNSVQ